VFIHGLFSKLVAGRAAATRFGPNPPNPVSVLTFAARARCHKQPQTKDLEHNGVSSQVLYAAVAVVHGEA
jgi:hypothetical protein